MTNRLDPDSLREQLANLCHEQWSGWMEYLFEKSKCCLLQHSTELMSGDVVIPREFAKRWVRQMKTAYADLSKAEKDSDRKEADRFLKLFKEHTVKP